MLRLRHFFEEHFQLPAIVRVRRLCRIGHFGWGHIAAGARVAVGHPLHHPLGEQTFKRFTGLQQTTVFQGLGEEAGIEQVKDGVFNAAHVLLDRQPTLHGL